MFYFTEFDSEAKRVQDILSGMEKPQVCDPRLPHKCTIANVKSGLCHNILVISQGSTSDFFPLVDFCH